MNFKKKIQNIYKKKSKNYENLSDDVKLIGRSFFGINRILIKKKKHELFYTQNQRLAHDFGPLNGDFAMVLKFKLVFFLVH